MQVKKQKQLSDNQTNEQTSLFVILYRQEAEAYLALCTHMQTSHFFTLLNPNKFHR
jgi:nitrite reductase/ring-hydroxylating ferredoxin subunit